MKVTLSLIGIFAVGMILVAHLGAADTIRPSDQLPDTMPWDLKALGEPPAVEWIDRDANIGSLFYTGEPYAGHSTRVFAYYATPGSLTGDRSKDQDLPAVVLVHGGGGTAFAEWAELWAKRGYAAMAMDLAGCRPIEGKNPHAAENRERLPDGGPNQSDEEKFGSIQQSPTEQWPYHAVANIIRAHSLIRSFREVDRERTAVTGISWGGYLTCIVSGVDNRFRAAVPVYGCGLLHENSAWLDRFRQMQPDDRERWTSLWDPSRYLPATSMPILFMNGTNDFAYPLDSYMKSYDLVSSPKQLCVTVNMPHSHPDGWARNEIGLFIDQHLLGARAMPTADDPEVEDGRIRVATTSSGAIVEAALHWTTDSGPINQRKWQSKLAEIQEDSVITEMPDSATTAWFVTVTDDRGAVVSTRTMIVPARP